MSGGTPPDYVVKAFIELEQALLSAGLNISYTEPVVLELEDYEFRRLFWPRSGASLAYWKGDGLGSDKFHEPDEAYTTLVVRLGCFEIRRRKR